MHRENYFFSIFNNMNLRKNIIKSLVVILMIGTTSAYGQSYISVKGGSLKMSGNATIKADHVILKDAGVIQMTSDNNQLTLSGNLVNNSGQTLELHQGTIQFAGVPSQYINGTNDFVFQNIDVNASDLILEQDIQVNGLITLSNGNVDLRNKNINLSNTGIIINETNENRIKATNGSIDGMGLGKIFATRFIEIGENNNIAGLGIDINSISYVGIKTIIRSHLTSSIGEFSSISRSFTLPEFGQFSANNNVTIHYFSNELNGLSENNLAIYSYKNSKLSECYPTSIDNATKKAIPLVNSSSFEDNFNNQGFSNFTLAFKTAVTTSKLAKNNFDNEKFNAYYAPLSKTINIHFLSSEAKSFTVSIYNVLSAKVISVNFNVQTGENSLKIDASSLRKSMYVISMNDKMQNFSSKFIVE